MFRLWFVPLMALALSGCVQNQTSLTSAGSGEGTSCTAIASALNVNIDDFIKSLKGACKADGDCVAVQIHVARRGTPCLAGCSIATARNEATQLSRFLEADDALTRLCEEFAEKNCLMDVPSCPGGGPRCVDGICRVAVP